MLCLAAKILGKPVVLEEFGVTSMSSCVILLQAWVLIHRILANQEDIYSDWVNLALKTNHGSETTRILIF